MRLIDADRLLDKRMQGKYYHLPNGDVAIPIIDIEHAPTVEVERTGKWIPCSERLPENEGRYLVTNNRIGAWIVDFDFYDSFNKKWYYNQDVVAWMPLPEPYKERKEQ